MSWRHRQAGVGRVISSFLWVILPLFLALGLVAAAAAGAAERFDPAPLLRQAEELLRQGEVLESAAAWDQVYRLASDRDLRALALVRQGDAAALFMNAPDLAGALYERAIEEFPGSQALQNAWCNGAMLHYEAGRLQPAAQAFARCADDFPHSGRAHTARFMLQRIREELQRGETPPQVPEPAQDQREPVVRVRLELAPQVTLEAPGGAHLLLQDGGYETLAPGELTFAASGGGLLLRGTDLGRRVTLLPEGGGFHWQGQRYPGEAALAVHEGGVLLVNRLPLESYLWGVVPAEMPASFATEALKAQAVAARSYALALLRGNADRGWDLLATRLSQVYKGVRSADPRIRTAVEATEGEALVHQGRPVLGYFHSHSGGRLEDDAAVWNGDLPFYEVQDDPASNRLRDMRWQLEIGYGDLAAALRREGVQVGRIEGVEVLSRTASGRLERLRLATEAGGVEVTGTLLRKALGTLKMKSTLAELAPASSRRTLRLEGRGFGHGVGMSQWGAQAMALDGRTYRDILAKYYPGVGIARLW